MIAPGAGRGEAQGSGKVRAAMATLRQLALPPAAGLGYSGGGKEETMSQEQPYDIQQAHRQAIEQLSRDPEAERSREEATVAADQLPDAPADSSTRAEWGAFRRELPRLLAEGLAGRFALLKGDAIAGVYPTFDEAAHVGRERYRLQPFLVQPIRDREPLLRVRGLSFPCPNRLPRSPALPGPARPARLCLAD